MNVILQPKPIETKAVVIMYGWAGAATKNVKKYAELYAHHPTHKCAVVYGTASISTVMSRHQSSLVSLLMDSVRKSVDIIHDVEKINAKNNKKQRMIPVVVHYFSNGGAFMAETLDHMIKNINDSDSTNVMNRLSPIKQRDDVEDLKIISQRLQTNGYEVLDSAPAYIDEFLAFKVVDESVPNFPLRFIIKSLLVIKYVVNKVPNLLFGKEFISHVIWNNMIESELCQRQAFVYSTIDKLTDSKKLDEFIEIRQKRGIDVTVLKFDDSDHVMHMRKHPEEYREKILNHVLDTVCREG